jgi:tRNA(adenine34) deaminase
MLQEEKYKHWMGIAIKEAEKAYEKKEIPVGAVIIYDGKIIGRGFNQIETLEDPTAHAEMIAITAASSFLNSRRLIKCEMYVTLEPCPMCAGAVVNARLPLLVFGAYDDKAGACSTLYTITNDSRLNHRVHTKGGIMEDKCAGLLKEFFKKNIRQNSLKLVKKP